jgi:anti-anti-sigma factor
MKILQNKTGQSATVAPQGPIVGPDADQLGNLLSQILGEGANAVTLDLVDVTFVDSRGLEVLMEMGERLIRAGKPLRLAGANEILREVLRLTGLAPLFEFIPALSGAPEAGKK